MPQIDVQTPKASRPKHAEAVLGVSGVPRHLIKITDVVFSSPLVAMGTITGPAEM